MSTLLKKARALATSANTADKQKAQQDDAKAKKLERPKMPKVVATSYTSLPVEVPESFLLPLEDPSQISAKQIDFSTSAIPEYRGLYAIVLDNVLTREECDQLIHLAEQSAGAHGEDTSIENNGWRPAMINAGPGIEYSQLEYRNSDRIIWDHNEVAKRLWARCFQVDEIRQELTRLESTGKGSHYDPVLGRRRGRKWAILEQGLNERLRFLKYGAGQYFREHCDGQFSTPDGVQTSFYTYHLYLNDSIQALQAEGSKKTSVKSFDRNVCEGGATSFHSSLLDRRIDVDPKVGRVLIFQQGKLLHSGADVKDGIKYTVRSDLMYQFEK